MRRISPTGVVTLASGLVNPRYGPLDGVGSDAQLSRNRTVVADSAGVLFVIDPHAVRRIGVDNATAVRAGSSSNFGAVDGPAATARFNGLAGLAVGTGGKLFVGANNAVRLIDAGDNVSTFAGSMAQSGRVDGPVASARFQFLGQMAFAPDGSLYVVESGGGVLRRISPDGLTVSTVPAFGTPTGSLTIDSAGTMYYGTTSGLVVHPAVGGPSVLIPQGPAVVLGGTPSVMTVDALAVLGPKQLVLLSGGQILKATLP